MPNTKRAAPPSMLDRQWTYDEIQGAKQAGISLIAYAERQAGVLKADTSSEIRLEKAEQLECWKIFRAFGGRVYSLSQSRASKQTPGLGDGFVIFPGRVSFWWETKRQKGGRISEAQQEFQHFCAYADGSNCYIGARAEAEALVIRLGIATRGDDGSLYPTRPK